MIHSNLGASSAKRWMNCPGCIALVESLQTKDKRSEAAELGTGAHELGESALMLGLDPCDFEGDSFNGYKADQNMIDAVTVYVDYVRLCMEKCVRPELHLELKVNLHSIDEAMFGTGDCVIWDEPTGHLFVLDYKHGQGVFVPIEGNPQVRYYALGTIEKLNLYEKVKKITVGIIQPRCLREEDTAIRTMDLIPEDMWAFREELIEAVAAVKAPNAPLAEGDWCKFCKAETNCPEKMGKMHKEAIACFSMIEDEVGTPVISLPAPTTVTAEQRTKILDAREPLKQILKWMDAVGDHAKEEHSNGVHTPHYDIVPTRKSHKWRSETEAAEAFKELGDEAYTRKLKSPSALGKLTTVPSKLIETKQGWALKRVEETTVEAAIKAFENLIED